MTGLKLRINKVILRLDRGIQISAHGRESPRLPRNTPFSRTCGFRIKCGMTLNTLSNDFLLSGVSGASASLDCPIKSGNDTDRAEHWILRFNRRIQCFGKRIDYPRNWGIDFRLLLRGSWATEAISEADLPSNLTVSNRDYSLAVLG
jgi:hypothetical protein